jgi:hypothetical protein
MNWIINSNLKTALWPGGQLLEKDYWERLEEGLWGQRPRYRQTEDSGSTRKNVLLSPGMGSQWRENNPGAGMAVDQQSEEEPRTGLGSGYNTGDSATEQDEREAGPGFSPQLQETTVLNELFLDLAIKNPNENRARQHVVQEQLKRMYKKPVKIPKQYPVDRFK